MGRRIVGSPSRVWNTRPWAMLLLYFDSDGTERLHFPILITKTHFFLVPPVCGLLWSYFIPVSAGMRCYSGWMLWYICGCQCVHFYKSRVPLKAACTTFMYFLLNILSSERIDLVDKLKLSSPPFLVPALTGELCSLCSWLKLNFSHLAAVTISK